jgi:hypothetical protein
MIVHGALVVTYSLNNRKWNYQPFYAALKQQGAWWHYLPSAWLIVTSNQPVDVYNALAPCISSTDRILVMPVTKPVFGWLPQAAWDWIDANIP